MSTDFSVSSTQKNVFAFSVDGFEFSDYKCGYKTPMGKDWIVSIGNRS